MHGMRFAILLLIIISFSCTSEKTEEVVQSFDNGKPQQVQVFELDGDQKVLIETIDYYPNGQVKMKGGVNPEGERNGVWQAWYQDGTIWSEGEFSNGLQHGYRKVYHPNGQLRYEGNYESDKPSGEWIFYNDSGKEINRKQYD